MDDDVNYEEIYDRRDLQVTFVPQTVVTTASQFWPAPFETFEKLRS